MAIGNYLKAIEHIGSTSVPGLAAKPIIDIMAGAQNLADAPQFIPLLETHGYHYFPEYEAQIPERRYLTKSINGRTVVHLHIIEPTNQLWEEHLTFRDRLLAQPVLRNDYARLKTELAKHFGNDRVGYTEAKSAFIQTALKQNTH